MGSLPPEIWRLILQNLPLMVLQDLYLVNSVFLDVAMDARYHEVTLDRMDKQLLRKLVRLQDPEVACRVKSLRIAPHLFYSDVQRKFKNEARTQITAPLRLFSRLMHRLKRRRQTRVDGIPIHMTPGALMDLLQRLKNIHTFFLDGNLSDGDDNFSTIDLWPSIGQHLQDLTISVTSITLKSMLPAPTVRLPQLQRLQILIRIYEDDNNLYSSLLATASFVNSFEDTLQHLSIHYTPYGDISALYKHLGSFKRLWSIDIDLSSPLTEAVGGDVPLHSVTFLERHKHILRNLSLSDIERNQLSIFYSPQLGLGNHLSTFYYNQLHLPRLHHLSINANIMARNWDDMRMFMKTHRNTLESLEIVGPICSSDIRVLLFQIHELACYALTKLCISTYRLDLGLLLLMAEHLEWLKVLNLEIVKVAQASAFGFTPGQFFPMNLLSIEFTPGQFFPMNLNLPPDKDTHEFVREIIACQELKAWTLRDIVIKRRSCCGELVLWRLMQLFAMCIPTITSFAENGDMCIPEPLNVRPKVSGANCFGGGHKCVYGKDGWYSESEQFVRS
ncbi:hypothetical protein BJ912DRAFT_967114 [Pholiota molesta]|nr:hypothetical protein BJ912DRAFT_967114 [Pholiota molesta]